MGLGEYGSLREKFHFEFNALNDAPLKPHQRMHILRYFFMPRFVHLFTFEKVGLKWLKTLDWRIRDSVRRWLKLPKDTVVPFFYSRCADGGLGLTCLRWWVPSLRRERAKNVIASARSDQFLGDFLRESGRLATEAKKYGFLELIEAGQASNPGAKTAKSFALDLYHRTVEGKGLGSYAGAPNTSGWIPDGVAHMPANQYVSCIQVRAGTLFNKERASRGRSQASRTCEVKDCGKVEALSHIIQKCDLTKGPRIERHNAIVRGVSRKLEALGWKVVVEPRIPVIGGVLVPDLVAWLADGRTLVCDATVVSDLACLQREYEKKVTKYTVPCIRDWLWDHCPFPGCLRPAPLPRVIAYVSSWRGALSNDTYRELRLLGFPRGLVECFQIRVLWDGYCIWSFFKGSTWKEPRHARRRRLTRERPERGVT